MLSRLRSFFLGSFKRSDLEDNMSDEIRFHLETRTEDLVRSGLPAAEARRRARLEFGSTESYKEQCRQSRGLRAVDELRADLRYAFRAVRTRPIFALVAVITLALGIGANTAMFSVLYASYFQPIPVNEPFSLYQVTGRAGAGNLDSLSYREYRDLKDRNQVFADIFADFGVRPTTPSGNLLGYLVSGNYFSCLGVRTVMGRPIQPDDDAPGSEPVAVLGHAAWQSHFGADPQIVGIHIELAGHPYTVVGVAGPEFNGVDDQMTDFWAPLSTAGIFTGKDSSAGVPMDLAVRVIGRLKRGITPLQAQASLGAVLPDITADRQKEMRLADAILRSRATYNVWTWDPIVTRNVILSFIPFVLVLMIVCFNLANVQLARALSRQREIGVRLSLGAGRARIVRQLVTENIPIALAGGMAGLAVSHSSLALIRRVLQSSGATLFAEMDPRLDWRVFSFVLLLSAVAAVMFGLVPALNATRPDLTLALKSSGPVLSRDKRSSRLRDGLVVGQFALSMTLLIAAGGIFRSSMNSASIAPGCDTSHTLGGLLSQGAPIVQVSQRLTEMPGVVSVARATRGPLFLGTRLRAPVSPGPSFSGQFIADYSFVSPEYFDTLLIPILRGRAFTHQETESDPNVAIISQSTAQRLWPDADPIGQQLRLATWIDSPAAPRTVEVVGVAGNVMYRRPIEGKDGSFVYLPTNPRDQGASLLVRVAGDPAQMSLSIQSELSARFPATEFDLNTMDQYRDRAMLSSRISSSVTGATGLLGLLLASIGIYGVMAYVVNQRTREIGIRMSLGAVGRDVIWLVLRGACRLMALSGLAGLLLGFGLSRILAASIFKIDAADPLVFLVPAAVLVTFGLMAAYLPARRATLVDPSVALRYE